MKNKPALHISAAAGTDIGRVREKNEDAAFAQVTGGGNGTPAALLIVADGLGGHQAGEAASQIAIDTLTEELVPYLDERDTAAASWARLENQVSDAITQADEAIRDYTNTNLPPSARVATTVALVLIIGERAVVANVGDSRVYRLRQDALDLLTRDHTRAWHLAETGQIDPAKVSGHPLRNLLTRTLGSGSPAKPDVKRVTLQSGDRLLLCSDGLWGTVRDTERLREILGGSESAEHAVEAFVAEANARGGDDNIGVAVGLVA
jgi:protein phosphatase